MIIGILAAVAAAQINPADLGAPPELQPEQDVSARCTCPDEAEPDTLIIEGLVVDAQVILGADRRSVSERQATIFQVPTSVAPSDRVKIWHSTLESKCGLTFKYGKKYEVTVRKIEEGALETDACLTTPDTPLR